jgi:pimeloyl-ACP methyl ester carboxylesterase
VRVREIEEPIADELDSSHEIYPGYFAPPEAFVVGNEWRLIQPLRDVAAKGSSLSALIEAVAAQVRDHLSPGSVNLGMAMADLAVTGRRAYADFVGTRPREGGIIERGAMARLVSLGVAGWTPATVSNATSEVLDRAYQVAWFLRAQTDRGELGWIAVSGEDDLPHRPVNVPRTPFPQHDLYFTVPGDLGEVPVQTRFAVATADEPPDPPALPLSRRNLPPVLDEPTLGRTLGKDNRIILFINGSDSRLEEADTLIPKLVRHSDGRPSGYTVIALDLPGSGYASLIDHTEVGAWNPEIVDVGIPVGALGPIVGAAIGLPIPPVPVSVGTEDTEFGFAPATFSVLSFMERFIMRFVAALSTRLGQPGLVESQLAAVIGGSLGGNLALRLARRRGPWIRNAVVWDAGSVWPSMVRPASLLTNPNDPETGELMVGISAAVPKVGVPETPESRDKFFADAFDGKIPPSFKTQPEQWYRDDFWEKQRYIEGARLDRRETYTSQYRRWHWRVSLEELMWSWRDPSVQDFKSRILLGAGSDDDIQPAHIFRNTAQLSTELKNIDGDTFFFNHTGHSVHAERPDALGSRILAFLDDSDLVLFAENRDAGTVAFDAVRKDLQNTDPVWKGQWTPGWTNFQVFAMDGKNYLFGYKADDGTAAFDEIRSDLHNTKGLWKGMWTKGWTHFRIFAMGGRNYLFAYKAGVGTVAFDEIRSDLQNTNSVWSGMWTKDWTHFEIFSMGGKNYLFAYKAGNGAAAFDEIPSDLQNTISVWTGKWAKGWTHFQIFAMNGKNYVFAYNAVDGTVTFDEIQRDLRNTKTVWAGKWTTGLTNIQAFSMDGQNYLLRYKAGNGAVAFGRIRRNLRNTQTVWTGKWARGWTSVQIFPMT